MADRAQPHVVVIGGGFGGLEATRRLRRADVRVTLIDRRNHHLFQPLLYQVATAALSAPDIAAPIRRVLRRQRNATVLMAEVTGVDTSAKHVKLADGDTIDYDYLVVAAGATHSYFGHDDWAEHAPGLKTVNDAFDIRRRILMAYEHAERETDPDIVAQWLCFVIVGGGPTGVELAGACAEIAHHSLTRDFRSFDPRKARVILVEGSDRVLSNMPEDLSVKAVQALQRLEVEVRTSTFVTRLDETGVWAGDEHIPARVVLWAAGVAASPLGTSLGAETDRAGRVLVSGDLSVGDGNVFVIGDLAHVEQDGGVVPGVAPAAIQQGRYAARAILDRIAGRETPPFRYVDKGTLATIGRASAVARIGKTHWSGFTAWLMWVVVHIATLIGFRNRLAVMFEWAWAWLTHQRVARVILEDD